MTAPGSREAAKPQKKGWKSWSAPKRIAVECGAKKTWRAPAVDNHVFLCEWLRHLARELLPISQWSHYFDKGAHQPDIYLKRIIQASDARMASVTKQIRAEIEAVDYDDGWPTNGTNYCLVSFAIVMLPHCHDTRWPCELAVKVWQLGTTKSLACNNIISESKNLWIAAQLHKVMDRLRTSASLRETGEGGA